MSSGLITVSFITNGISWLRWVRISSGLLCAAEVSVDMAWRRISISGS
jgi:hypothetical protein